MIPVAPLSKDLAEVIETLASRQESCARRIQDADFREAGMRLLEHHLGRPPRRPLRAVHCVGDSHTLFFAGAERFHLTREVKIGVFRKRWINRGPDLLPCFRTWHLGPATAFRAAFPRSTSRSLEKIRKLLKTSIPPGSTVLLCFGEIDCRVHLPRLVKEGQPQEKVVKSTADSFLKLPRMLRDLGFRPAVWGPPTVVPQDERLDIGDFPFVGSWELRRDITLAYIQVLQAQCRAEGIPAVSLANQWHDLQTRPSLEFLPDRIHLSQALMPLALSRLIDAGILDC